MRLAVAIALMLSAVAQAAEHHIYSNITTTAWDCPTEGVNPGDTIYLHDHTLAAWDHTGARPGGIAAVRTGRLHFTNCVGSGNAENRIFVKNHPDDEPVIITNSATIASTPLRFIASESYVLDGTGDYVGKPEGGYCGAPAGTACGIQFKPTGRVTTINWLQGWGQVAEANRSWCTSDGAGTACYGGTRYVTWKGLLFDLSATYDLITNGGVGIYMHDVNGDDLTDHGGLAWREDFLIEQNYFTWVYGEAIYAGNNSGTADACFPNCIPNRNITIRNNAVYNAGRDPINVKMTEQGTNEVSGNYVVNSGLRPGDGDGQKSCFQLGGSYANVFNNTLINCGYHGMNFAVDGNDPLAAEGPWAFSVYNNVIIGTGATAAATDAQGININTSDAANVKYRPSIYNNTIINSETDGIGLDRTDAPVVRNNIVSKTGIATNCATGAVLATNTVGTATVADNVCGDPSATGGLFFVAPVSNDYALQASSPAVDAATTAPFSATDIDGTARPQGAEADAGAYEYTYPTPPVLLPVRRPRGIHQ